MNIEINLMFVKFILVGFFVSLTCISAALMLDVSNKYRKMFLVISVTNSLCLVFESAFFLFS